MGRETWSLLICVFLLLDSCALVGVRDARLISSVRPCSPARHAVEVRGATPEERASWPPGERHSDPPAAVCRRGCVGPPGARNKSDAELIRIPSKRCH